MVSHPCTGKAKFAHLTPELLGCGGMLPGSEVTANLDWPWEKCPKPQAVGPVCNAPLDWCGLLSPPSALGTHQETHPT